MHKVVHDALRILQCHLHLLSQICSVVPEVTWRIRENKYSPDTQQQQYLTHLISACVYGGVRILGKQNCRCTFRPHLHLGSCKAVVLKANADTQAYSDLAVNIHTSPRNTSLLMRVTKQAALQGCHYIRGRGERDKVLLFLHQQTSSNVVLTQRNASTQQNLAIRRANEKRGVRKQITNNEQAQQHQQLTSMHRRCHWVWEYCTADEERSRVHIIEKRVTAFWEVWQGIKIFGDDIKTTQMSCLYITITLHHTCPPYRLGMFEVLENMEFHKENIIYISFSAN